MLTHKEETNSDFSRKLLDVILSEFPITLSYIDNDLNIMCTGGAGLTCLGLGQEDLVGMNLRTLLENNPETIEHYTLALKGGAVTWTTRGGNLCFESHVVVDYDSYGNTKGLICVTHVMPSDAQYTEIDYGTKYIGGTSGNENE